MASRPFLIVRRQNRTLIVGVGETQTRTEFPRSVRVRVLPGMQVVQPATEEYPEERKERVGLCGEDCFELEKRVKVEYGWIGQRSCDCVECGTLRRW